MGASVRFPNANKYDAKEIREFVDEIEFHICTYIEELMLSIFHPSKVSVPVCSASIRGRFRSPLCLRFKFEVEVESNLDTAGNSRLALVGESIEEDTLMTELQKLPQANPLSEATSVEVESSSLTDEPDICLRVPQFIEQIPLLGDLVNKVLCLLFGPAGIFQSIVNLIF